MSVYWRGPWARRLDCETVTASTWSRVLSEAVYDQASRYGVKVYNSGGIDSMRATQAPDTRRVSSWIQVVKRPGLLGARPARRPRGATPGPRQ
jgi:hypothetical protein